MFTVITILYIVGAVGVSFLGLFKGQDFIETFFLSILATPLAALFFVLYRDMV
ncbi:MAG: hypothetical protein AAFQ94_27025 [Bacteroidota bacterium]